MKDRSGEKEVVKKKRETQKRYGIEKKKNNKGMIEENGKRKIEINH